MTPADIAYADRIATVMRARMPSHVDIDDVAQDARVGLCDAAARWDPDSGVPLSGFAARRISGAIADGGRRDDYRPRYAHRQGVPPPVRLPDLNHLQAADDVAADAAHRMLVDVLVDAIERLPDRLRSVIIDRYWHDHTWRQIGDSHGLSETGACRRGAAAVALLRSELGA